MATKIAVNQSLSFEEFDIAGKLYRLKTDDQSLAHYRKELVGYDEKIKGTKTDEETREAIKLIFDLLLGKGSFDQIYEDTGKSLFVMADIIYQIGEHVERKFNQQFEKAQNKYIRKKK